jgi:hypothetical protein
MTKAWPVKRLARCVCLFSYKSPSCTLAFLSSQSSELFPQFLPHDPSRSFASPISHSLVLSR